MQEQDEISDMVLVASGMAENLRILIAGSVSSVRADGRR